MAAKRRARQAAHVEWEPYPHPHLAEHLKPASGAPVTYPHADTWQGTVSVRGHPASTVYLGDHVVMGAPVLPGAAYAEWLVCC